MKVLIATTGTRGDIEPFLALADALVARGHVAEVSTDEPYRPLVEANGYRWVAAGEPTTEAAYQEIAREALQEPDPMKQADIMLFRWIVPRVPSKVADFGRLRPQYDAIVLNQLVAGFGIDHREAIAGPALVGLYMPWNPRTLQRFHERGDPTFIAWNDQVISHAPYTFPSTVSSGYWFRSAPRGEPSDALQRFLAGGAPPVVFTFGSLASFPVARLEQIIVGATERAGVRAILHSGRTSLGDGIASPQILCVDEFDPDWLFPRASCVVHHGGSGTTGVTLRAGKPAVVVPQWGDQVMWAQGLLANRASSATLRMEMMTEETLADAITRALVDPAISRSVAAIAQSIARDPGCLLAAERLEAMAAR